MNSRNHTIGALTACTAIDAQLHNWLDMARERISFQGLPARICWVGLGQRAKLGLAFK